MPVKTKALLYVCIDSHFTEMIRVARMMKASGRYEPVLFFEFQYGVVERDLAVTRGEGFECLVPGWFRLAPAISAAGPVAGNGGEVASAAAPPFAADPAYPSLHSRIGRILPWPVRLAWRKLLARLRGTFVSKVLRIFFQPNPFRDLMLRMFPTFGVLVIHYSQMHRFVRDAFNLHPFGLVVLPEDNPRYFTPLLVRHAHRKRAPVVIVPFTVANALEFAEAYFDKPECQIDNFSRAAIARLFPSWVMEHKGRKLLATEGARIVLLELLLAAPADPWIINSGNADVIAVESEAMSRYYLDCGLDRRKLCTTGALYDDVVAGTLKDRDRQRRLLCEQLGLDGNLPILLCALPPDQISDAHRKCEFDTYDGLVASWIQALKNVAGYSVVFKLHPRVGQIEARRIEAMGARIADWDTATLVPLCDLYVASVSATIRMAIACGIPVLNYDVFRYRYRDFKDVPGVVAVEEQSAFEEALARVAGGEQPYLELRDAQRKIASRWGTLDGRSGERMLALFDSLARK